MKPYLLKDDELKELTVKIPGWEITPKYVKREFKFNNFIEAFSFMNSPRSIASKRGKKVSEIFGSKENN